MDIKELEEYEIKEKKEIAMWKYLGLLLPIFSK